MQLAHGVVDVGVNLEFLIVAGGMLALGILFFVQRTFKPAIPVVLVLGSLALGVGAFVNTTEPLDDHDTSAAAEEISDQASLEIATPGEGDSVSAGADVTIEVELQGAPDGGHYDVRIDDEIATMTSEGTITVTFEEGEHVLSVEYVTAQHQPFDPRLRDEITVTAG